jgi:hypothetical protein
VRRNSFRFGQAARTDIARLLDDEDDGDDMGLLEAESLRMTCILGTSPHDGAIAPDADDATEKAVRRGSFRLSSRSTSAENEEDQTKRTVFRRGSFRLSRRASLDTGSLLGSNVATDELEDAGDTEIEKESAAVLPKPRRMSLDMSSFLDTHDSSPVAIKLKTEVSIPHVGHRRSQRSQCTTLRNAKDLNESSSPRGETENRDLPPAKELATSSTRARLVRRTKSHGVGHGPRSARELRRANSHGAEADACQSPGRDNREASNQKSPSKTRREPVRRGASSSAPSSVRTKSSERECSSPRRRTCASHGTRQSSSKSRQSPSNESDRDSARTNETCPEGGTPRNPASETLQGRRRSDTKSDSHRSKPTSSSKSHRAEKSTSPDAALSSSSSAGSSRPLTSRSESSFSRRSVSRSCSRSRRSRGEHAGRREGSREKDECLGGATLIDKLKKPHPQASTSYLPTAFTNRHDSDSEDDSNSYDDASDSECSSSIQLDILNPAFIDHYVSAAVSLGSHGHGRDFVGANINVVPGDEDDDLSDDEDFQGEAMKSAEELAGVDTLKAPASRVPLPFNSVLDHFGFRRRTEGSPAC